VPRRIPTYRPSYRSPAQGDDRPTAAARGYCSAAWRRTRLAVIARDQGICQICGELVVGEPGDIDHIVEKAKGGTDAMSNLRLLHKRCHSRRTATSSSSGR
jgi:5-methylcytosine-specific restriction endonuclease McrA